MSHDLTTLGIASQNMVPNTPSLDSRPLFQSAAQYAQNNNYTTLTLDPGSYYLLSNEQSNGVLLLNVSNMTIDLAGSTLYFVGPLLPNGIALYQCSNVTFTNFQTDFLNPPYTHVQLTSVDTTNRLLYYQTITGWPDPVVFNGLTSPFGDTVGNIAAFFRNGEIIAGTSRTQLTGPFSNNTLPVTDGAPWAQSATLATLQAGDTVVVTTRAAGPPLLVWQSDSITLSNVHVYGSPNWAVEIYNSSNTTVDNVSVEPRPVTGLVGSDGDGIHFTLTLQNGHIRNSYVARTMDDALIMDTGEVAAVVSQGSPTQLTVTRNGYATFPQNALMNFIDPDTTLQVASAHVVSQSPPFSNNPLAGGQVVLTFDQALPTLAAGVLMVYGDPDNRGQGSTIEDNTVVETDGGRGIWINGVDGVTVQRNVLLRTSMAGIIIENDTSIYQAGPATNIVIQNNALESDLGPAACGTGVQFCVGAIEVTTDGQSFAFASQPSNTNITVQNNYIADSGRSGIWLGDVDGGTVQNNVILRYSQNPTLNGTFGIPTPDLADLVTENALLPLVTPFSTNITSTNNTIEASSPITAPVAFTPASATLPASSSAGSFGVQTVVAAFDWRAASDSAWLTITSGGAGPGTGTVQFAVTANTTGAARTGNIIIAGVSFPVTQTTQIAQTVTFAPVSDVTVGTASFMLGATASSGLAVGFTPNSPSVCTVSGNAVTIVAVGICSITANQPGNSTWWAAPSVTQTFTVSAAGIQPAAAFLDQNGAPALTFNNSTSIADAGGYLIGTPGVTQDLYGNVYVVGLDSAGGVHLNSYSFANSSWNGWQYSGGILDTSSGLTAAVDATGVVWFAGRDIGNRFWINSWNGASFGGWILVADGIFASDSVPQIAIPPDGSIYVIGKDIGGRIWSNSYIPTSQTFTGWVDRQAVMIGQPSATAGQDGLVYVAVRSVSSESPVYITQIPAQNAVTVNTWLNGGGLIDTDPQITSQGGTVYLLAEADGNTVYLLTFSEATQTYGTWNFTNGILNSATIATAAGNVFIAGLDSGDRIYWYSVTGNSWFLAGGAGVSSTVLGGGK